MNNIRTHFKQLYKLCRMNSSAQRIKAVWCNNKEKLAIFLYKSCILENHCFGVQRLKIIIIFFSNKVTLSIYLYCVFQSKHSSHFCPGTSSGDYLVVWRLSIWWNIKCSILIFVYYLQWPTGNKYVVNM